MRARDRDTLRRRVQTIRHEIGLALADVREATFEQDRGLEATSLTGRCTIVDAWRTLDCSSVASTWIYQPGSIEHDHGADLGTSSGMLVRLDPFDPSLESFGAIVVAKVGAGKSYLLKLVARRLTDAEVFIVEHRSPPEYAGIAGAVTLNLGDTDDEDALVERLDRFISDLWDLAKRDPRPRVLILDELWRWIRKPRLAVKIEEIARIGRHYYLSLWIATQQVRELLSDGQAVLDNAMIRIFLKQHDRDLDELCEAVGLAEPARQFLRSAPRGQALLDVNGMVIPVDIQASPDEHRRVTTDPRELATLATA